MGIGVDTKTDNDSDMKVKPTESVIKRGVPKNTKPAPAVVAVKMADLLSAPDDRVDQDLENNATRDISSPDHIGNECDDVKSKEMLEKQKKDEKLKLEKELKQHDKLKKEEEAKAKKERERLATLQKKEAEKLKKLKKEEEAKAKKVRAMEEKRQKQEKEKIEKKRIEEEKQNQLEEKKAKKEAEKLAKTQKQDQEKMQKGDDSKAKEPKDLAESGDKDEQHIDNLDNDKESSIGVDFKQDDGNDIEVKPTESVIKRGVPKNTKPAPAVAAIKMADLLSAIDDEVDQDQEYTPTGDV